MATDCRTAPLSRRLSAPALLGLLWCSALLSLTPARAEHDLTVTPDMHGPDDVPAQTDISQMGYSDSHLGDANPYYVAQWSFDDTAYSGGNSGDGCFFFDSDDIGGYSDFAICVSFSQNQSIGHVELDTVKLFDCKNSEPDNDEGKRCPFNGGGGDGSNGVLAEDANGDGVLDGKNSYCTLDTATADPFASNPTHTGGGEQDPVTDTGITCVVYQDELVELDGDVPSGVKPSNVCSFTSPDPGSESKDCVADAGAGFLRVATQTDVDNGTPFEVELDGQTFASLTDSDVSDAVAVAGDGTYTVSVTPPTGWQQDGASCDTGEPPDAVTVLSSETVTCTFLLTYTGTTDTGSNAPDTVASHEHVYAFEDLKNIPGGANDFDYNDFIMRVALQETIDGDGYWKQFDIEVEALARGAAYKHRVMADFGISGLADISLEYYDSSGTLLNQTSFSNDGPTIEGVALFHEDTWRVMPEWTGEGGVLSNTRYQQTASQRIQGRRTVIRIVVHQPVANPSVTDDPSTKHLNETLNAVFGPWLEVLDTGERIQQQWRLAAATEDLVSAAQHGVDTPLLGYSLLQAVAFPQSWRWPVERIAIWNAYPLYVDHILSGYTTQKNWYQTPASNTWPTSSKRLNTASLQSAQAAGPVATLPSGSFAFDYPFASPITTAPAVADIDGRGGLEVVVGEFAGPIVVHDRRGAVVRVIDPEADGLSRDESSASVTLADLDGDGDQEILRGYDDGVLLAFHHDGSLARRWNVAGTVKSTAAVADIDNDGEPEIFVLGGDARLYGFAARGGSLSGFPVAVGGTEDLAGNYSLLPTPLLVDLDGDGGLDIVAVGNQGRVVTVNGAGDTLWSIDLAVAILSSPAAADLDGNGTLELVLADATGGVTALSAGGQRYWRRQLRSLGSSSSPALADLDGDGSLDIVVGSDDGKVYAWNFNGRLLTGWPVTTESAVKGSPIVADVDGDGRAEVFVASYDTRVYGFDGAGNALRTADGGSFPVTLGASLVGAAALADLDGDGHPSLLVGGYDRTLYALEVEGDGSARNAVLWQQFRGDSRQLGRLLPSVTTDRIFLGGFD